MPLYIFYIEKWQNKIYNIHEFDFVQFLSH